MLRHSRRFGIIESLNCVNQRCARSRPRRTSSPRRRANSVQIRAPLEYFCAFPPASAVDADAAHTLRSIARVRHCPRLRIRRCPCYSNGDQNPTLTIAALDSVSRKKPPRLGANITDLVRYSRIQSMQSRDEKPCCNSGKGARLIWSVGTPNWRIAFYRWIGTFPQDHDDSRCDIVGSLCCRSDLLDPGRQLHGRPFRTHCGDKPHGSEDARVRESRAARKAYRRPHPGSVSGGS